MFPWCVIFNSAWHITQPASALWKFFGNQAVIQFRRFLEVLSLYVKVQLRGVLKFENSWIPLKRKAPRDIRLPEKVEKAFRKHFVGVILVSYSALARAGVRCGWGIIQEQIMAITWYRVLIENIINCFTARHHVLCSHHDEIQKCLMCVYL